MRCGVALIARKPRVFSLQRVSGLRVIKRLLRRYPVNQREVFAVVLGVAFRAVGFIRIFRVKAAIACQLRGNFRVASLAIQNRGAFADHMATRALRGTV